MLTTGLQARDGHGKKTVRINWKFGRNRYRKADLTFTKENTLQAGVVPGCSDR